MPLDPRAANALRLFQRFARNRRAHVSEKAQQEFLASFGREADISDVWDAVVEASEADIHKSEADRDDEAKTVMVLRLPFLGHQAYVKATIKMGIDESVYLLSCKRWGL